MVKMVVRYADDDDDDDHNNKLMHMLKKCM